MSSHMEWSPDFCLSCDRQLADGGDGAYCSQACRLADLERGGTQANHSPLSSSASSTSSGGFHLPPAVNFSAYKTASASSYPPAPHYQQPSRTTTYYNSTTTAAPSQPCSLSPSSSQSSLSYMTSSTSSGISAQAASQLNDYARAFDQVREMKRRFN